MCEICGCEFVKAGPRLASANGVPVTLAAIPVRVVEPSAKGAHAAHQREHGVKDPPLQRQSETALRG